MEAKDIPNGQILFPEQVLKLAEEQPKRVLFFITPRAIGAFEAKDALFIIKRMYDFEGGEVVPFILALKEGISIAEAFTTLEHIGLFNINEHSEIGDGIIHDLEEEAKKGQFGLN